VNIERHWWNGISSPRGRRDVYILTDGERWDVKAQMGGVTGRFKIQECPSLSSATILAGAWRGSSTGWREQRLPTAKSTFA
jgi:hypothetical protein